MAECVGPDTDARDADGRIAAEVRVDSSQVVQRAGGAAGTHRNERPHRLVAAIDERRPFERDDASLERVVDTHRRKHEMRHPEVAAQPARATLDHLAVPMLGELFEEVLDQVLLGQALEHLDLLDRDRRLVCDRAGEVELAGPVGDEGAEQLLTRNERHRHASGAAAPTHLRPELAQPDRRRHVVPGRLYKAAEQPVLLRVAQVEAHRLGAEQLPCAPDDFRPEHVERLGRSHRFREPGELLELAQARPRLVVELRVLDRPRYERCARDEKLHFLVGELARCDGVERDRADGVAALAVKRHRDERLKPLLFEFGDVLHARIVERLLANERRPALRERPPREPLPALQLDAADEVRVRGGCSAQHEPLAVAIEQVDEAGMRGARIGEQPYDTFQDLLEVERGADRRDDLMEEALFACSCRRLPSGDPSILEAQRGCGTIRM